MHFTTTIRTWQASGPVEGDFNPLSASWIRRFDAPAFAEPLQNSDISTLFGDMHAEGVRFWLSTAHPELGYRWLIKDLGNGRLYLVEPATPRFYDSGIRHVEVNARRLPEEPMGLS